MSPREKLSEISHFITWDRVAIALMGVGSFAIKSEISNFRETTDRLNNTMVEIREQIARSETRDEATNDKFKYIYNHLERISDRLRHIETKSR